MADRLFSAMEVMQMAPPEWLVDDTVPRDGISMLVGQSGVGKSFMAVDLAMHIAAGKPWLGHEVKQGPVIYVAAEGFGGMSPRINSWMRQHGSGVSKIPLFILGRALFLMNAEEVENLLEMCEEQADERPVLIIIDTVAKAMFGGDENSAQAIGTFLQSCDVLKRVTGAAILLLHHLRKDGLAERGSSALRAGVDQQMLLRARGDSLTLKCQKQKDFAPFEDLSMVLGFDQWQSGDREVTSRFIKGVERHWHARDNTSLKGVM